MNVKALLVASALCLMVVGVAGTASAAPESPCSYHIEYAACGASLAGCDVGVVVILYGQVGDVGGASASC